MARALVMPLTAPVPREYALPLDRKSPSAYGRRQVATGPYMVRDYEPGKRIHLVRNPNWRPATDFKPAYRGAEGHVVHATWSRSGKNLMPTVAEDARFTEFAEVLLTPEQANELVAFFVRGPG